MVSMWSQDCAFSFNGKPLKFIEQFIYLSSYISSTESNINMHIGKSWTATYKLISSSP